MEWGEYEEGVQTFCWLYKSSKEKGLLPLDIKMLNF